MYNTCPPGREVGDIQYQNVSGVLTGSFSEGVHVDPTETWKLNVSLPVKNHFRAMSSSLPERRKRGFKLQVTPQHQESSHATNAAAPIHMDLFQAKCRIT